MAEGRGYRHCNAGGDGSVVARGREWVWRGSVVITGGREKAAYRVRRPIAISH